MTTGRAAVFGLRRGMTGAAVALSILAITPTAVGQAALSDAEIRDRANEVLQDKAFQSTRPETITPSRRSGGLSLPAMGGEGSSGGPKTDAAEGREPTDGARPNVNETGSGRSEGSAPPNGEGAERIRRSAPSPVGDLIGMILIAMVGVLFAVLLAIGIRALLASRSKDEVTPNDPQPEPLPAVEPPRDLGDIEALAAAGRFDEAIHGLFVLAVARLAASGELRLGRATTGREALRDARLDEGRRRALAEIAELVEVSLFGGAPMTGDHYQRARAAFQALSDVRDGGARYQAAGTSEARS